jgi:glycosyltransferase involved in cell wall biosynthesis
MRLLALSRYGRLGASSRLRTLQYLPWLERAGIHTVHHALLNDSYVQALYRHERAALSVVRGYLRRLKLLLDARQFDALFVEKEALPWIPAALEMSLLPKNVPLIFDLDDAVFHRYDRHFSWIVRRLLGSKIDKLLGHCSAVTVGNRYLGDRAVAAGCKRVEVIPTVVDLERYGNRLRKHLGEQTVVIGWIGSPASAHYLGEVVEPLRRLCARYSLSCLAIGANREQVRDTPFVSVPWEEDTEVDVLHSIDIGIMPLCDGPWERGKCGYKLIQYMACGVPVVASAIGANRDIVKDGDNGFLVETDAQWCEALERLIVSPALRARVGLEGRRSVEQTFSLQVQAGRLVEVLRSVAGR